MKSRYEIPDNEPISMFCGFPVIVATLPMFDAVATAMTYGIGRQFEPSCHVEHERRHDQAHDVVHEKRGEQAAGEDHGRQQMVRVQTLDDPFGDSLEEAAKAKVRHDDHHREQQHDRREIDGLQRLLRSDDAEGDHQYGADDCGSGRSIFIHGNFPSAKTK